MVDSSKFQIDITQGKLKEGTHVPTEALDKLCASFKFSQEKLESCLKGKSETLLICEENVVEEILDILESLGISAEAQLAEVQEEVVSDSLFGNQEVNPIEFDLSEDDSELMSNPVNTKSTHDESVFDLGDLSFDVKVKQTTAENSQSTASVPSQGDSLGIAFSTDNDDELFPKHVHTSQKEISIDTIDTSNENKSVDKQANIEITSNLGMLFDEEDEDNIALSLSPVAEVKREATIETEKSKNKIIEIKQFNNNFADPDPADQIFNSYDAQEEVKKEELLNSDNWLKSTLETTDLQIRTPFVQHTKEEHHLDINSQKLSPSKTLLLKRQKQIRKMTIGVVISIALLAAWSLIPSHEMSTKDTFVTESQIKKIVDADSEGTTHIKNIKKITQSFEGTLTFDGIEGKITCKVAENNLEYITFEFEKRSVESPSEEEYRSKVFLPRFVSLRGNAEVNSQVSLKTISSRVSYKQGKESKKLISNLNVSYNPESQKIRLYTQDKDVSSETVFDNKITFLKEDTTSQSMISVYIEVPLHEIEVHESNDRSIADLIDSQLKKAAPKEAKKDKKEKKIKASE